MLCARSIKFTRTWKTEKRKKTHKFLLSPFSHMENAIQLKPEANFRFRSGKVYFFARKVIKFCRIVKVFFFQIKLKVSKLFYDKIYESMCRQKRFFQFLTVSRRRPVKWDFQILCNEMENLFVKSFVVFSCHSTEFNWGLIRFFPTSQQNKI